MDFNFIVGQPQDNDLDLFFGPIVEDDQLFILDPKDTMANVMTIVGTFPSITQARKNGHNKPIPSGFTDKRVGKLKTRITILNAGD